MAEGFVNLLTTHNNSENNSIEFNSSIPNPTEDYGRLIVRIFYPVIIIFGTLGNLVTFIVMQRGSLKHSSTCFYMAVLALNDTGKWIYLDNENNTLESSRLILNKEIHLFQLIKIDFFLKQKFLYFMSFYEVTVITIILQRLEHPEGGTLNSDKCDRWQ